MIANQRTARRLVTKDGPPHHVFSLRFDDFEPETHKKHTRTTTNERYVQEPGIHRLASLGQYTSRTRLTRWNESEAMRTVTLVHWDMHGGES